MADALLKTGRYEIVRELGRGSMGVVYQGFDPIIGRTVAIKTMLTEGLTPDEYKEFRARFQREAQAAGVLNHPNIVNVFDYGEDGGILYLIMEFLEGKSLEKLVEATKILPIETIIPMCEQVCGALDHAHQHGIVHRDIKPANIMILNNGMVKVTDFGIAKMMSMGMTQTGLVLGTPNYMSPEQVKGRQVDGRSDLFSLGVILYDLVTGEKPFSGQNITTVIYKIINENPVPPRELDASIHAGLSYVICKALAKSPDERYQTGRELADDLKNFKQLGGQTAPSATMVLKTAPSPGASVASAPAPTVMRPAEATSAAMVAPGAPQTVITQPPVQAPAPDQAAATVQVAAPATVQIATPATAGKPRSSPAVWVFVLLGVLILAVLGGGYFYLQRGKSSQPAVTVAGGGANGNTAGVPGAANPAAGSPAAENRGPGAAQTKSHETPAETGRTSRADSRAGGAPATPSPGGRGGPADAKSLSAANRGKPATSPVPAPEETPSDAAPNAPAAGAASAAAGGGGANAAAKMGQLQITANVSGARITIDGSSDPGWLTPYSAPISLSAGTHQVVISKDGYAEYPRPVSVEAGKTATINAVLSEATGEVMVITSPPGLQVSMDGKALGASPVHITLPAGSHKYTVRREGWEPYEGTVNVKSGAEMTVKVNMGQ